MRRNHFLSLALTLLLVLAVGTDLAYGQRGRGGGRGGGPAALDQETILEEFDSIVELIWADEEEDAWDDLDDDDVEGKQAFITAFWERRDPTPGTTDNEYREVWMGRVATAARQFAGEGNNGWETDRGKFFLIYGQEALVAQQTTQVGGGGGSDPDAGPRVGGSSVLTWTVDPTQNPFLDGKEEVAFAQYQRSYSRSTGGIRLDEEAFLAGLAVSTYFELRRANPAAAGPAAAPMATAGGAAAPGTAATAGAPPPTPDLAAMQQLMQSGVTMQDLALRQQMAFIPAQEGNSFAIFNFDLAKEGLTFQSAGSPGPASMLAFGVLLKMDPAVPNGQFLRELKIPFAVDPSNGSARLTTTHSFGMTLEPGDYRLAWGVMDNGSERIATASHEFAVPDYGAGELGIPSVIIATGIEQKPDAIDINTVYPQTRIGQLELATNLDNEFGRNDSLLLLYFIQGLGVDPGTGQNRYEITHRILIAGTEESIARLPAQELLFAAVEQPIPLAQVSQLEAGLAYEIEITIDDKISGNQLVHKVPFSVRGG